MSKEVDPRWSCYRKKAYPSEREAQKALRAVSRRVQDVVLNVYPCPHCGRWHIGRRAAWNKEA